MFACFNLYMTIVHSSTVAAILCQLPTTCNPKTVGGMCYAILGMIGLTSLTVQIINNQPSWPSLHQAPLDKHQSATANHRPEKLDTQSQHVSVKPESYTSMQSTENYPSMHSKRHCIYVNLGNIYH